MYEIYASCAVFGVNPCSGVTNFSPLIDNVRIRNVGYVAAPAIQLTSGSKFQDGFGQGALGFLSPTDAGNANVVRDLRRGHSDVTRLGDSLAIAGAPPTGPPSRWEAKLWFRLKRMGPGQGANATFNAWRAAIAAAKGDFYTGANPGFAWGYMDSVESGVSTPISRSFQFCSFFRDGPSSGGHGLPADLNYNWGGGGERASGNAILPDLCFTPGTKVQYFLTSNYVSLPTSYYYLPDTTGKNYYEFEILPSYRTVEGVAKFPCTLYIDASEGRGERSGQHFFEQALFHAVIPAAPPGDPLPDPAPWDRYDYGDASSSWAGPFYRTIGGHSGATLPQMLGYGMILLNTGNLDAGCMEPRDFQGFQQWLEAPICEQPDRQSFVASGSNISAIVNASWSTFLTRNLGAAHSCDSYNDIGCPAGEPENDTNYCIRLSPVAGSPIVPGIPIDVFANWCPSIQPYGVVGVHGGIPAMEYRKLPLLGPGIQYSAVVNDNVSEMYRTVIADQSLHMMITPDGTGDPGTECTYADYGIGIQRRIDAGTSWLTSALGWLQGGVVADLALCVNPCTDINGVPDQEGGGAVTRLYQNHPNPFNPRTQIRFSLAADGPAKVVIYDVNGRRIRNLVDDGLKAGMHQVIWDGTDDSGRAVASGVYWIQLHAGDYSSNRKMVILK